MSQAMKSSNGYLVVAIISVIVMIALVFSVRISPAHSPERPDLNGWFADLANGKKQPCCDGSDADVLKDSDWESKDGHYRVFIEGKWWDVPDEAVVIGPNKFGRTMVWPIIYRNYSADDRTGQWSVDRIVIRCFMPGSMI